jgi:hypothetical protein
MLIDLFPDFNRRKTEEKRLKRTCLIMPYFSLLILLFLFY